MHSPVRSALLRELRARVAIPVTARASAAALPFGVDAVDSRLAGGGLVPGLHEVAPAAPALAEEAAQLAAKCHADAPLARTLRRRAEDLAGIADGSADLYVALRTFDSAWLDVRMALIEARRVLGGSGRLFISISDGYLDRSGTIIKGQIGRDGAIDRATPWRKLLEVTQMASDLGFADFAFHDLETEIAVSARAS